LRGDLDTATAFAYGIEIIAVGVGVGHAGEKGAGTALGKVLGHHGGVVGSESAGTDAHAGLLERIVQDVGAMAGAAEQRGMLGIDGADDVERAGRALPGDVFTPGPTPAEDIASIRHAGARAGAA
jgi:hypothetical protein